MKRTITAVQRKGMETIIPIRPKHVAPPSCAFCRHARTITSDAGHAIDCGLGIRDQDPRSCGTFRDARMNLDSNYLRIK